MRWLLTVTFTDGTDVSDTYTDWDRLTRTLNFVLQGCTVADATIKAV